VTTTTHTDITGITIAWEKAIAELDQALSDAMYARADVEVAKGKMAYEEARLTLVAEGKNETERKAHLHLSLDADALYFAAKRDYWTAWYAVQAAERRATVAKERCRLYRAQLALATGNLD
jgi:hypothetical protein